ncbi:unnamed protein product [Diamesa tonsa]
MDGECYINAADQFLRPVADPRSSSAKVAEVAESKNPVKVEMQLLRLKEESQNMILSTLKSIYGDDFEFGKDSDYKDQGTRLKKGYWKDRGELIIQGGCDYSFIPTSNGESGEERMKLYALTKLESYGFHKRHCWECLSAFADNIDDSINLLYDKYFPGKKQTVETDLTDETRQEMMNDELEALQSIYVTEFTEAEKNHIWQMKIKLDYLMIFSPSETKKEEKRKQLEMELKLQALHKEKMRKKNPSGQLEKCRNMVEKGKCKYGDKCRFSHDVFKTVTDEFGAKTQTLRKKDIDEEDESKMWHIEIRFPKWCKYPADAPIILIRSKISDIPKSICLRINQRLIQESRMLALDEIPSIYSIIELLQNSEEILSYLRKNHYFQAPSSDQSIFDYDPHGVGGIASEEKDLPSHHQRGKIDKFDKRNLSKDEQMKENQNLLRKFKEKERNQYYQKMLKGRQNLPAWSQKEKILRVINGNQVTVISGDTGCGKSTQIPQFILDDWMERTIAKDPTVPQNIDVICTQPRRISAISVAERVSDERNERVGSVIGYQIRLENKISISTRLTFCTTGILLRRLYSDPLLESVTHLVIDEVHERSEESDFLLLILKEVLEKRANLKVILMSATLNAKLFSDYFTGCPTLTIPGRTFPVQQFFLEDIIERSGFVLECDSKYCKKISKRDEEQLLQELEYADVQANKTPPARSIRDENLKLSDMIARYIDYSKTTCKSLFLIDPLKINPELIETVLTYICESNDHDWPHEGTILIFLPGLAEIQTVYDTLQDSRIFGQRSGNFLLIPLHSSLTNEEQGLVFKKAPQGKRKIVMATNIAETSITIEDCVFVIDCGQQKEKHFDSNRNMESLETVWISRANAQQRKGRAGRVMPGISIHLFTQHRFNNHFLHQPVPEIHRIPLEQLLLRIKTLPNFKGQDLLGILMRAIEPPSPENIASAVKRLQNLGAFEEENLTPLGRHLSSLPVDVRIGKLMLFGAIFQCLDSILTICACLSHKSPFVSPFSKRQQADAKKRQFAIGNSDHLTVLNAYRRWKDANKRSRYAGQVYAEENYLSSRTMEMLGEIKYQFLELLISIGFVPVDLPKQRKQKSFDDNLLELTGSELNVNGENSRVISAILCAALYPNIVKVLTPEKNYVQSFAGAVPRNFLPSELRFKTRDDGYISLHPSSVNATIGTFNSPFLIYQEKVKTSKIFIRETTMVATVPLILFSGSDVRIEMHNGDFVFLLEDSWIMIQADSLKTAESMKYMRKELSSILEEKIKDPLLNLWNHEKGKKIIGTIVHLLMKE